MNRTPLSQLHETQGATFSEYQGWRLPSFYGGLREECEAAKKAVALVDRSNLGKLRLTGRDSLDLLHRLSTNDLLVLKPGMGATTVLTTNKGRIVELLTIYVLQEDELLLVTGAESGEAVAQWIDKFNFDEDVHIHDATQELGLLYLSGPRAAEVASDLLGPSLAQLKPHHCLKASLGPTEVLLARAVPLTGEAFSVLVPADRIESVWKTILEVGLRYGVTPLGEEAYDVLRVEAGLPAPGKELTEEFNPWEARLDASISVTKGCYVGQEVIARLHTYEKVQKRLMGLDLGPSQPSRAAWLGSKLVADGGGRHGEAGVITSAVHSPGLGRDIGLGYVRLNHAEEGHQLALLSGSEKVPVAVVELPFRA